MSSGLQECIKILESNKPKPARSRLGRWFQQKWAMIQLRRGFAKQGVHVWKYTDEELKEQMLQGLKECVAMLERDELERMYKL